MSSQENLPALTIDQAWEKLKETPEGQAAIAHIEDLRKKSVVALGTDEAFTLRDNTGEIRAFKQPLWLTMDNGGLIQPTGSQGPTVVSAQGYELWADAAGATVIFPQDVKVGNEFKMNPYVERDTRNGRILCVYARAIAFRFSSKGIPQVSDWTTIFDTPSYRMIDLLGKAKKTPQAFRLLPNETQPDGAGTWAAYPFDEATTLWMNTSHDEVLTWLASIINREKKSIDFAQTFAKRNALKHLSGIQKAPADSARRGGWCIAVTCWRPVSGSIVKWDATQYAQLQRRVAGMIQGDTSEFEGRQIEFQQGTERTSDTDIQEADATDDEPIEVAAKPAEQPAEAPPKAPEKSAPRPEPPANQQPAKTRAVPKGPPAPKAVDTRKLPEQERERLVNNLDVAREVEPEIFAQVCRDMRLDPDLASEELLEHAAEINRRMNEIIDKERM
jgi:hypothetical protein